MSSRPTLFALARETLLNIISSPVRTTITVIFSAAVGAVVVLATAGNVDDIVQAHEAQQLRGLSTLSLTALDGEPISASACDSINAVSLVNSAGGVLSVKRIEVVNGEVPITIRYVTPGYLAVAYPQEAVRGLDSVAGHDLVDEIGVISGTLIRDASNLNPVEPIVVDAAASQRARFDGINRDVLLSQAPVGDVSECLVDVADGQADRVTTVLPTFFTTQVVVRPFLPPDQVDRNPALELEHRWSSSVWVGGGLGIVLFVLFAWWSRRNETALYRLVGFDRRSIAAIVGLETVLVALVPAQLASFCVLALLPVEGGAVTLAALTADTSRLLLFLLLGPPIAIALSLAGSTVDRLKGQ